MVPAFLPRMWFVVNDGPQEKQGREVISVISCSRMLSLVVFYLVVFQLKKVVALQFAGI